MLRSGLRRGRRDLINVESKSWITQHADGHGDGSMQESLGPYDKRVVRIEIARAHA